MRKPAAHHPRISRLAPIIAALALLAGCATPGPNRGYYLNSEGSAHIVQFDPSGADTATSRQASHLRLLEAAFGFAYDPFTDHFFIRLNPGDRFLVVDRPDRSVKRRFQLTGVDLPPGLGDIAIRSRDRHLFIINPLSPELIETNLNGAHERTIPLDRPAEGVAYDQSGNRLLTLHDGKVTVRDLEGRSLATVPLARAVKSGGLAFDSAAREYFALLDESAALGVFAEDGRLLRTLPMPAGRGLLTFDVGPHSLLRLF